MPSKRQAWDSSTRKKLRTMVDKFIVELGNEGFATNKNDFALAVSATITQNGFFGSYRVNMGNNEFYTSSEIENVFREGYEKGWDESQEAMELEEDYDRHSQYGTSK